MAEIRRVEFPTITLPADPAGKSKPISKNRKVEQSPLQQIFTREGKAQATGHLKVKQTNPVALSNSVEKAKAAMLKFYQPDKKAAKETAPLGQIIDIKV